MPIIKITHTSKGSNTGSCAQLEKYLQKENKDVSFEHATHWYDQERTYVSRGEVVHRLDNNHKGLSAKDAKFFMVTINYSEKEIAFIHKKFEDNPILTENFKLNYTREVMNQYASNFKRNIQGTDLLYFAINEQNRYHKGNDKEVLKGKAKQRERKDGLNEHTHIIVSRKDKFQKLKLSPLTNHIDTKKGAIKGGFDRVQFKLNCEMAFDALLGYSRDFDDKAEVLIKRARGEEISPNTLAENVALDKRNEMNIEMKNKKGMSH
ncbi:MAG: DUF5712 family protein [Bacteroidota bacterium]|nr:DUF5712 family protein [Bacteroidota bacterium]